MEKLTAIAQATSPSNKIALIVAFLWLASPVSSHLIAHLEVTTNDELEKYCKVEKKEEEA